MALAGPLAAQETDREVETVEQPRFEIPLDDFDRGTPRRSADGYLAATDKGDYERAAEYLDMRNLRGEAVDMGGKELARRLSVVIRRANWIDIDELIDDPRGRQKDGLPSYRDSIGVIRLEDEDGEEYDVRLLMQKVPRGDGVYIWKVSNASVAQIPTLYEAYGYSELIERLRANVPDVVILGYDLFKWIVALSTATAVYLGVIVIALLLKFSDREKKPLKQALYQFLMLPFGLWALILVGNRMATYLGGGVTAEWWSRVTPLPTIVTIWMLFAGANLFRDALIERLRMRGRSGTAVLLPPLVNAIKVLLAALGLIYYLNQMGINVTTVLAGLGVGGIAVALALQKPLEDVLGALTLYTQQPMKVGDFCRIGQHVGTIEEISLRTTRIRTLANTVIAVPNAKLATEAIDNISARSKILFNPQLRLRYDTPEDAMQAVLEGIRTMLSEHEHVAEESRRVRFKSITHDALQVEVFAYVTTTDWQTYLEIAEDLNTRIVGIINAAGTSLAPPVLEMGG